MLKAVLLSGGRGTRLGEDIPKQYLKVSRKMIIEYSMETLLNSDEVDSLVIVADSSWEEELISVIKRKKHSEKFIGFAKPGEIRQMSIYNGLMKLKETALDQDIVLIQDAARPRLKFDLINRMAEKIYGSDECDGVLPVLPMKDTVYMVDGSGKLSSLLDRKSVVAGQAPELFLFGKYLKANEKLIESGRMMSINGSSEVAFLAGMNVITIPGDEGNFKITTKEDLRRFRSMTSWK